MDAVSGALTSNLLELRLDTVPILSKVVFDGEPRERLLGQGGRRRGIQEEMHTLLFMVPGQCARVSGRRWRGSGVSQEDGGGFVGCNHLKHHGQQSEESLNESLMMGTDI